jgi:hypothetical protein
MNQRPAQPGHPIDIWKTTRARITAAPPDLAEIYTPNRGKAQALFPTFSSPAGDTGVTHPIRRVKPKKHVLHELDPWTSQRRQRHARLTDRESVSNPALNPPSPKRIYKGDGEYTPPKFIRC